MASRRIENNWGSANSFLNAVKYFNSPINADAVSKSAPKDQREFVKLLVDSMQQCFTNQSLYIKETESRVVDVVMGRIASLLDEVKATFLSNELQQIKDELIESLKNSNVESSDKDELYNKITILFSNVTTKEELNDLKDWLHDVNDQRELSSNSKEESEQPASDEQEQDETVGDYKDSTIALNFDHLQNFIQTQVDQINENLKNIPGQSGILSIVGTIGGIAAGIGAVTKFIGSKTIMGIAATVAKVGAISAGIVGGIGLAIKGIKSIGSGIKNGIGKIGKGIAAPFKKIGSVFSSINPFAKKDEARKAKQEEKKQALRDKIFNFISKIIDKIWKIIEPFVDKVGFFMGLVSKFVIIPIAIMALKVALIVAAIVAIGIGLYLAYQWVKAKVMQFINYVFSGQLWEDIKASLIAAWEWMKDFGGWLWKKLVDFGKWYLKTLLKFWKFILIDIPIWVWEQLCKFGVWLWDKLCEFGKWLYENYIDKYVIQPLAKLIEPLAKIWVEKIQPKIQPFLDSLMQLKDTIFGIFKGWDTNKSFWENIKNMAGLIKDAVVAWWNESPFKVFYEKYLEPFVNSAADLFKRLANLGGFIKQAILDWWNGDSSLGDTLKNIGTTVKNVVVDWWNGSIFKKTWDERVVPLIDKLKNYLNDLIKPIREWYETSWLKQTIDTISEFIKVYIAAPIQALKIYLTRAFVNLADKLWIPKINMDWGKFKKLSPIASLKDVFSFEKLYPLKNLVTDDMRESAAAAEDKSLSEIINDEMSKMKKNIEDKSNVKTQPDIKQPNVDQSHNIVMQNMGGAIKPIKSINDMKTQNNVELQKTGEAVSVEVSKDKKQNTDFMKQQNLVGSQVLAEMRALRGDVNKYGKDPLAVTVPIPVNNNQNSAMMGEN